MEVVVEARVLGGTGDDPFPFKVQIRQHKAQDSLYTVHFEEKQEVVVDDEAVIMIYASILRKLSTSLRFERVFTSAHFMRQTAHHRALNVPNTARPFDNVLDALLLCIDDDHDIKTYMYVGHLLFSFKMKPGEKATSFITYVSSPATFGHPVLALVVTNLSYYFLTDQVVVQRDNSAINTLPEPQTSLDCLAAYAALRGVLGPITVVDADATSAPASAPADIHVQRNWQSIAIPMQVWYDDDDVECAVGTAASDAAAPDAVPDAAPDAVSDAAPDAASDAASVDIKSRSVSKKRPHQVSGAADHNDDDDEDHGVKPIHQRARLDHDDHSSVALPTAVLAAEVGVVADVDGAQAMPEVVAAPNSSRHPDSQLERQQPQPPSPRRTRASLKRARE